MDLVRNFSAEKSVDGRDALVQQIIYTWAGVSSIAPNSRGAYIDDARKLASVEKFMGEAFIQSSGTNAGTPNPGPEAATQILDTYNKLASQVKGELLIQTHYKNLYDSIGIKYDDVTKTLSQDSTLLRTKLAAIFSSDAIEGPRRLEEFAETLSNSGPNGQAMLSQLRASGSATGDAFTAYLLSFGMLKVVGTNANDTLSGTSVSEYLTGGIGNDTINGYAGNDLLLGQDGADNLNGGIGNDTLNGGIGNDYLNGDVGNDTYQFAIGSGSDTISDYDTVAGNSDTVVFSGVASTALTALERIGNNLVLRYGTSDQLTVSNYFSSSTGYKVELFQFSDNVIWNEADIKSRVITKGDVGNDNITGYSDGTNRIYGLDGNDTLYGGTLADTIEGGIGNDTINGYAGNDLLLGQDGADNLNGGIGNDTLNGGIGNDYLNGDVGNDTYQFAIGSGSDTISDYDTVAGNSDVLAFNGDIAYDQLWFTQSGGLLKVSVIGTTDSVTINNWGSGSAYQVEKISAGGKSLSNAQVSSLVQAMASMTPPPMGQTTLTQTDRTQLAPVLAASWT